MPTDAATPKLFFCAFCRGTDFQAVVRGETSRQQAAGHGEVSMEDYACTNRHHGKFFQVVECARCRLRALYPWPRAEDIEKAYIKVKDDEYLSIEEPRIIAFNKILDRLEQYRRPPGKLLDVGCYTGLFASLAQKRGWEVTGVEPSVWAAEIARKRLHGAVHQGYLAGANLSPGTFDVVTSWDVIEHVTDPAKELALMARVLKPGGWLCLSTMHSEALVVKILGARWPWYMPMHLFYFTPQTLRKFVEKTGLNVRDIAAYPHYTTVQYVLWKLEPALGKLGTFLRKSAERLGLAKRIVKVDLKDFFLMAAQKPNARGEITK